MKFGLAEGQLERLGPTPHAPARGSGVGQFAITCRCIEQLQRDGHDGRLALAGFYPGVNPRGDCFCPKSNSFTRRGCSELERPWESRIVSRRGWRNFLV